MLKRVKMILTHAILATMVFASGPSIANAASPQATVLLSMQQQAFLGLAGSKETLMQLLVNRERLLSDGSIGDKLKNEQRLALHCRALWHTNVFEQWTKTTWGGNQRWMQEHQKSLLDLITFVNYQIFLNQQGLSETEEAGVVAFKLNAVLDKQALDARAPAYERHVKAPQIAPLAQACQAWMIDRVNAWPAQERAQRVPFLEKFVQLHDQYFATLN